MAKIKENKQVYLIGLTGNIGTGKSLVCKMLEHLGALTVDADKLAHSAYLPDSQGYKIIIEEFGSGIINEHGQIDRRKLASMVFEDPQALHKLELLLHPLVIKEVNRIKQNSSLPIMVVEAIKLFESGLSRDCDSIWLVDAPLTTIKERLSRSRQLQPQQIEARLKSQLHFEEVKDRATIHIDNAHSVENTWQAIKSAWQELKMNSKFFNEMDKQTKTLLIPTLEGYLLPDAIDNPSQIVAQLKNILESFSPYESWDDLTNLMSIFHADSKQFDKKFLYKLLCTHHVWSYKGSNRTTGYFITEFGHETASALDGIMQPSFSDVGFQSEIKIFEYFCSLHLKSDLEIYAHKDRKETILLQMGYDKHKLLSRESHAKKPEYNVYKKILAIPHLKTVS